MKKIVAILLIVATLLSFAGCGKGGGGDVDYNMVPTETLNFQAIYNMVCSVDQQAKSNVGKTILLEGREYCTDDSSTGHYINISDGVCCNKDIEYKLPAEIEYPEDDTVFHLYATINTTTKDNETVMLLEGYKVIYEETLREMYEEEE